MGIPAGGLVVPALPYLLSFCRRRYALFSGGGADPGDVPGGALNVGTLAFALGFTLMMALDVALG